MAWMSRVAARHIPEGIFRSKDSLHYPQYAPLAGYLEALSGTRVSMSQGDPLQLGMLPSAYDFNNHIRHTLYIFVLLV